MNDYYFLTPNEWKSKLDVLLFHLQNPQKPVVIFISGAAGMGKSSVSIELCHLLGIRNHISTDTLRCVLASKETSPLLSYFSHECWKIYEEYTPQNMVNGFRKQSELLCDAVDVMLKDAYRHKQNAVIEGIHLLPSIMLRKRSTFPDIKMAFIYLTTDFDHFLNVLLPNRSVSTYRHRSIGDYDEYRISRFKCFYRMWMDDFARFKIPFIENSASPTDLIDKILDQLLNDFERR